MAECNDLSDSASSSPVVNTAGPRFAGWYLFSWIRNRQCCYLSYIWPSMPVRWLAINFLFCRYGKTLDFNSKSSHNNFNICLLSFGSGILCVIWVVVAFFLVHDSPTSHPRISVEEKQYFVSYSQSSSKKVGFVRISSLICRDIGQ